MTRHPDPADPAAPSRQAGAIPRAGRQGELLDVSAMRPSGPFPVTVEGVREPVASVVIEGLPPHLDRPFDYLVPASMDAAAQVGTRVQVRMAGREHTAYVLSRGSMTEHVGELAPLKRVVTGLPVLTPAVLDLARTVARTHAGTVGDVLRLALPPRHAGTEASELDKPEPPIRAARPLPDAPTPWDELTGGPAFLRHVAAGGDPRAVWGALPGTRDAAVLAAVRAALAGDRGALVLVPSVREVRAVAAALSAGLDDEPVATLLADDGPARRYRAFLRVLLGRARVVVGTRAAAYAPVARLGLVIVWDDADDAHVERRAPYAHTREVARLRSHLEGAALAVGGHARSVRTHLWVEDGEAAPVVAERPALRRATPRVSAPTATDLERHGGAAHARIPPVGFTVAREALARGPVLVQVARGGYLPVIACARCGTPARCGYCAGPLAVPTPTGASVGLLERDGPRAAATASCERCARPAAAWRCPECGGAAIRARRVGSARTAAELGRAFPRVPVIASGLRTDLGVVETVDDTPRIVVATPGAEPVADGGYAAALILDAGLATARGDLGAEGRALRRWFGAAALVRPAPAGGQVLLLGHPARAAAQALVRWDPAGATARDTAERRDLGLPPVVACAAVEGTHEGVTDFLARFRELVGLREPALPGDPRQSSAPDAASPWEVLGPTPLPPPRGHETDAGAEPQVRAVLRGGPRTPPHAQELADALARVVSARGLRRAPGTARVRMDPDELW